MRKHGSVLYSGITSATNDPKPTPRELQAEQKEQDKIKLKPAAEVVLEILEQERANVTDIRSIVLDRTTTEAEINTELIARKLYLGKLNSLEAKIKTILTSEPRKKKKPEVTDE